VTRRKSNTFHPDRAPGETTVVRLTEPPVKSGRTLQETLPVTGISVDRRVRQWRSARDYLLTVGRQVFHRVVGGASEPVADRRRQLATETDERAGYGRRSMANRPRLGAHDRWQDGRANGRRAGRSTTRRGARRQVSDEAFELTGAEVLPGDRLRTMPVGNDPASAGAAEGTIAVVDEQWRFFRFHRFAR
jgi:hypothetical protein